MKTAADPSDLLRRLLKRMGPVSAPALPDTEDPVAMLVLSFLMWESTTDKAIDAYRRLRRGFIDYNELRVSLPHEILACGGQRDSRALDRCQRLRASLNDLFRHEHAVTLERLRPLGKKEQRRFIDALTGMVPYVASRLGLLCFDSHSIPVDDQLRALLIEEGVAGEAVDVAELSSWLSRQVRAADGREAHLALQALSDRAAKRLEDGDPPSRRTGTVRKSEPRKPVPPRQGAEGGSRRAARS